MQINLFPFLSHTSISPNQYERVVKGISAFFQARPNILINFVFILLLFLNNIIGYLYQHHISKPSIRKNKFYRISIIRNSLILGGSFKGEEIIFSLGTTKTKGWEGEIPFHIRIRIRNVRIKKLKGKMQMSEDGQTRGRNDASLYTCRTLFLHDSENSLFDRRPRHNDGETQAWKRWYALFVLHPWNYITGGNRENGVSRRLQHDVPNLSDNISSPITTKY